jgi:K+-transporting ATPase ATPase F chain|nr:K(+)-transporting ATPase subunit F [Pantoea sp. GbtcB22]
MPRRACLQHYLNPLEVAVSVGVIAGIVLVFVLLGYLIYALLNAEAF